MTSTDNDETTGEKLYDAREYAKELGFSDEDAKRMGESEVNATNMRRVARKNHGADEPDPRSPISLPTLYS